MTLLKKYSTSQRLYAGSLVLLMLFLLFQKIILSLKMKRDDKIVSELTSLLKVYKFKDYVIPLIIAQFAHETGNFKSKIFLENNNPSGMKYPSIRKTTAIGIKNNHAVYISLASAVQDFGYYFDYFKIPQLPYSICGYIQTLKSKGYFEDSEENYRKGVERFYKLYYEG